MKKLIAVLLVVVMIAGILAGCGAKKSGGTLTMGTNAEFPPYEYYEGDKIVGIDGPSTPSSPPSPPARSIWAWPA